MMRYSLASLFGAILFFAVAFAGLVNPSEGVAITFRTGTLVVLLLFILIATFRHGKVRAFAVGFCILGCSHYMLANSPTIATMWGWGGGGLGYGDNYLATRKALMLLYPHAVSDPHESFSDPLRARDTPNVEQTAEAIHFFAIGIDIWTLLLAIAGGFTARWLSTVKRKPDRPTSN